MIVIAFTVIFLVGTLFGYVVARRRKVEVVRADVTVQTLDDILKLDRALYHEHDGLDHKSKDSPHVGLWLYRDNNGRVHVDNRFHGKTNDDNRETGETAAEALKNLLDTLRWRAEKRRGELERGLQ